MPFQTDIVPCLSASTAMQNLKLGCRSLSQCHLSPTYLISHKSSKFYYQNDYKIYPLLFILLLLPFPDPCFCIQIFYNWSPSVYSHKLAIHVTHYTKKIFLKTRSTLSILVIQIPQALFKASYKKPTPLSTVCPSRCRGPQLRLSLCKCLLIFIFSILKFIQFPRFTVLLYNSFPLKILCFWP